LTVFASRLVAAGLLAVGCQGSAAPLTRRIVPHRLPDCEVEDGDRLVLALGALGDFATTRAESVALKKSGDVDLPAELLGVEASTAPPSLHGVGYAAPPEDVHLTMWSTAAACRAISDDPVPRSQGGQAIAAFQRGAAVLVAGLDPVVGGAANDSASALVWSARTGQKMPPSSLGAHRVSWASATPFGESVLVAGGLDRGFFPPRYLDSALVLRDGTFPKPPISIGDRRARHGAVVLASGATLLVGGEDEGGVLNSLVTIAPSDVAPYGVANVFMLGTLARARKLPTAMRLSTDEILVAGGVDNSGNDVPTLEWFSQDGGPCTRDVCTVAPAELAALEDVAFIALPGGGALAVGGFARDTGAPASTVLWIDHDGTIEKLPSLTLQQRGTKRVRLVAAGDGAPWLWNGDVWLRYDPWQNTFFLPDAAPEGGPDDDLPAPVAVDPGLFVWLSRVLTPTGETTRLRGFRHGVRGPYTHDPDFLLADPRHLSPSRPPRTDGALWADAEGLHLSPGTGAVITDTTYGNVIVSGETPRSSLPTLELGGWAIGPPGPCPWPRSGTKFTVTRTGRTLLVAVDGDTPKDCTGPDGRVTIGLRGPGPETITVKQLTVGRR
jgi:hypothetical protein